MRQARQAQQERARRRRRQVRGGGAAVVVIAAAAVLVWLFSTGPASKKTASKTASKTTTTAAASGKAAPCPAANGSSARRTTFGAPPPMCIDTSKSYSAVVKTDVGSFTISLDTKTAPKTVNDFVYLARYHFYDGLTFHRVIPGFVVQGGDPNPPTASNPNPSGPQGPGYNVAGEAPKAGAYKIGSVAMAKTSADPNGTASSQFFVIVGPQGVSLPPDYSLFGQVTSGMNVVDKIEADGTSGSGIPRVLHKMLSVTIEG